MLSDTDILNIKCELYFQTSRSGAQIVRRRQNKSSAILVAIIVVFLICHIHRLVFRIYELAHPEKSLYKHYLKCEIFWHFIFTIITLQKKEVCSRWKVLAKCFKNYISCMFRKTSVIHFFFHFPFLAASLSPLWVVVP